MKNVPCTFCWLSKFRILGVYGEGPSSYDSPQTSFCGQYEMSVALVQPPQVHQHVPDAEALATAAALVTLAQPLAPLAPIVGTPLRSIWESHSLTWALSTEGVLSRVG